MNFYTFSTRLSSVTIQAHAVGLRSSEYNDGLFAQHKLIQGIYDDISFPVVFRVKYGKRLDDVLDTGWPSLFLISDKVRTVLADNNLTGWETFPIKLLDKKDQEIAGYYGLSATGKAGPIDYTQSKIIEKQLVTHGPAYKYYKGFSFGLDKWNECDFFLPENYFGIMVTQKVADLLKKSKLTNIVLKDIAAIETHSYIVDISLKER